MNNYKLSIIIVSWNIATYLDQCLASLFKYCYFDYEIIVVDNASSDQTVAMVKKKYPTVKLIINEVNQGFARANNQGVDQSAGDFLLFLNPDIELIDNSLEKAISYLANHQQIGMLGVNVLNSDQTNQISVRKLPSLYSQLITLLKLNNIIPSLNQKYFQKDFDYHKTQQVESIIGACMLIKRTVYEAIGRLDNDYFVWFEEVDLCLRLNQRNLPVYYFAETKIIHHGKQSFKQMMTLSRQALFNRSMLIYFKKHRPWSQFMLLVILLPLNYLLTFIQQILNIQKRDY
ncbi:MAG: glycosyltransferase family 2 protein [Candidatus Komeilibacteria bacterium]